MEKTVMEKAIDLKGKVRILLSACSEVSDYLSGKMDDIDEISSRSSSISESILNLTKEKEAKVKALQQLKAEYETVQRDMEELKSKTKAAIEQQRSEANRFLEDVKAALANAQAKDAEAGLKLERADKLKIELEEKLSAIRRIGGGSNA